MKNLAIILSALSFLVCSCTRPQYRNMSGMVWNTTYSITYCSNKDLSDSVREVMRNVELSLSMFNEKSIVSAVNRSEDIYVDKMFEDVFAISQYVSKQSGGVFDPTIAPIVNLWGFGSDNSNAPTDSAINASLRDIGIGDCYIENHRVKKKTENTKFDFSAVAKGYGCDAIGEMLTRNGCEDYLVEIGGEIVAKGVNSKNKKWRVMIDAPVNSNAEIVHSKLAMIEITNCGVATSGNYRNYRTDSLGNKVTHTLSPITGHPIISKTLSATVIAQDCGTADALATACMAMPSDSALKMINDMKGVSVLLVMSESDSTWQIVKSENFPEIN